MSKHLTAILAVTSTVYCLC